MPDGRGRCHPLIRHDGVYPLALPVKDGTHYDSTPDKEVHGDLGIIGYGTTTDTITVTDTGKCGTVLMSLWIKQPFLVGYFVITLANASTTVTIFTEADLNTSINTQADFVNRAFILAGYSATLRAGTWTLTIKNYQPDGSLSMPPGVNPTLHYWSLDFGFSQFVGVGSNTSSGGGGGTTTGGFLPLVTSYADIANIVTAGVTPPVQYSFKLSGKLQFWLHETGTAATTNDSDGNPYIVRPNDYDAGTNTSNLIRYA